MLGAPKPLVIIGAGRFAAEGAWTAEDINSACMRRGENPAWNLHGFVVFDPSQYPSSLYSYPVLGTPEAATEKFAGTDLSFICLIGDNRIREENAHQGEALGWHPVTLVHPTATLARETTVGPGSYIAAGSVISPFAQIGRYVVVNHHVSVGHDTTMGDFSQASPGARLSGRCVVGRSAFIGSNATLLPGCSVGEGATVGAGSVALRFVAPATSVFGVPAWAQTLKYQEK